MYPVRRMYSVDIDTDVRPYGNECDVLIYSTQRWHNHIRGIYAAFHVYDGSEHVVSIRPTW